MSLDLSKLQNVKTVDGKTTARCPACAASGGDAKGNHLVLYPEGKYGCAANPQDKAHTKEIFRQVGLSGGHGDNGKITVRAVTVPASSVLMDLRGFERFKVAPIQRPQTVPPAKVSAAESKDVPMCGKEPPACGIEEPSPVDQNSEVPQTAPPVFGWVDLDGKPLCKQRAQRAGWTEPIWSFLGVSEEEFNRGARN